MASVNSVNAARVGDVVETARPYVERIAQDKKLQENLRTAFSSAQRVYAGLQGGDSRSAAALHVAIDPDLRDEVVTIVGELRTASARLRSQREKRARRRLLFLLGLGLLVFFNPLSGRQSREFVGRRVGRSPALKYDYDV